MKDIEKYISENIEKIRACGPSPVLGEEGFLSRLVEENRKRRITSIRKNILKLIAFAACIAVMAILVSRNANTRQHVEKSEIITKEYEKVISELRSEIESYADFLPENAERKLMGTVRSVTETTAEMEGFSDLISDERRNEIILRTYINKTEALKRIRNAVSKAYYSEMSTKNI